MPRPILNLPQFRWALLMSLGADPSRLNVPATRPTSAPGSPRLQDQPPRRQIHFRDHTIQTRFRPRALARRLEQARALLSRCRVGDSGSNWHSDWCQHELRIGSAPNLTHMPPGTPQTTMQHWRMVRPEPLGGPRGTGGWCVRSQSSKRLRIPVGSCSRHLSAGLLVDQHATNQNCRA